MKSVGTPVPQGLRKHGTVWFRFLAPLLAAALVMSGLTLLATPATAADGDPPGVQTSLDFASNTVYDGDVVVQEDEIVTLTVNYSRDATAGSSFTVQLPPNFPFELPLNLGDAAEDLTVQGPNTDNQLTFTFNSPIKNTAGLFSLTGKLSEVTNSEIKDFVWSVNGTPNTTRLVYLKDGDSTAPLSKTAGKSRAANPFAGLATVTDGVVSLPASVIGKPVTYTVTGFSPSAVASYTISDVLPAHMTYVANSFEQTVSKWDENGLNKVVGAPTSPAITPTPGTGSAGASFTHSQAVAANSEVKLSYQAVITDEAGRLYWEQKLQAEWDALNDDDGGNAVANLTNTATVDGTEKTSTVSFSVNRPALPRPDVGVGSFNKVINAPTDVQIVEKPAANGDLATPINTEYTLSYNLGVFNSSNKYHTLKENVVVRDTLRMGMQWAPTLEVDLAGQGLTKVATCPTTKHNLNKNEYCVDGLNLYIGVGKNPADSGTFTIKARITNVNALDTYSPANLPVGEGWKAPNRGRLTYTTDGAANVNVDRTVNTNLNYRGEGGNGYNDTNYFVKQADNEVTVKPGERAKVKYTITAKATEDYPTATSTIVDHVDREIFDIPADLDDLKGDIVASYAGTTLTASEYTITEGADGSLRFALTPAKAASVANKNAEFKLVLTLTTFELLGKQAIDIVNLANLEGEDDEILYWSEKTSSASSFGNVAEVRKRIRDSEIKDWSSNLRVAPDSDQRIFVYRVEFLPRGTYGEAGNAVIVGVTDKLPEGVSFEGFVDSADVDNPTAFSDGPQNMGGNMQASYEDGKVLFKSTGPFQRNVPVAAYFAVELDADVEQDQPIVNQIGSTSATVTKTDGYPLAIVKQDASDESKVINDPDSRFELLDSDDEIVVSNIFVDNGTLKVLTDDGVKGLKVAEPGTYTLRELIPPTGYIKTPRTLTIKVIEDVVPPAQTFVNDPITDPQVKVGDYVWIDKNHDGLQDDTDVVVPGVELKIEKVDADGVHTDVTGVNNMPVPNQTTDADGKYLFELLPVLEAGEKYKVTIVSKPAMLDGFVPTKAGPNNGEGANDSSTDSAITVDPLATDGAKDLTLDFGFVKPWVSVGDYVWIDVNKNGIQEPANDVPLQGVKLRVYGPDDVEVTKDVYGDAFDVVTDDDGYYIFDNLPPLLAGQKYTVKIDQDEFEAKFPHLLPTKENGTPDKTLDSSTWSSTTIDAFDMSVSGTHDPTLDFGFFRKSVSVGDFVWEDINRDGLQDPDEPGIKGVVLEVFGPDNQKVTKDADGNPVDTETTDEHGKYSFDNLPELQPGETYTVKIKQTAQSTIDALAPFVPTIETPDAEDSEEGEWRYDSSTWEASTTGYIDLTVDGGRDPSLDFGFVRKYVSVGDYVWIDLDRNGLQNGDDNDIPVEGVTLKLFKVVDGVSTEVTDVMGKEVLPTVTDEDGWYEFTLLPVLKAGESYRVEIDRELLPETLDNFIPTEAAKGTDRDIDSEDWTASNVRKLDGTAVPAEPKDSAHVGEDPSLDFGFVEKSVSVGDFVWYDKDEDGFHDDDEEPLSGVTLKLVGPDGKPVTDVFGDIVEPTSTDSEGFYSFDDLPALPEGEHYTVIIDYENSPILVEMDLVPTNPGDRGDDDNTENHYSHTDSAASGDLTDDGDRDPTLDFGFRKAKVSVGDYVWIDVNRDGLQDASDIAVKGVVLNLTGPDGQPVVDVFGQPVGPQTTDAKGRYLFENLPVLHSGHYTVTIDQEASKDALEGLIPTSAGVGKDKGKDSSTDKAASWKDLSTDGAADLTLDFGFVRPSVSVGDYVWLDKNADGIQGKSEKGIPGVVLKITGPDGKPVKDVNGKRVRPQTTDKKGHYLFTELPPLPQGQSYTVTIVKGKSKKALKDLSPTKAEAGKNRAKDSSKDQAVSWKDLSSNGAMDLTLDFGFHPSGLLDENLEDDPKDDGVLPRIGSPVGPWAIAAALLMLVMGTGLVLGRRRES